MKKIPALLATFVCSALCIMSIHAESSSETLMEIRKYFLGEGVAPDPVKAAELAKTAAELGDVEAMQTLGYFYLQGAGVEKNEQEAAKWYEQAARGGSPRGQMNYGLMLLRGRGVEQDQEAGIGWLEKAAAQGLPQAQYTLGELYFTGDDHLPRQPDKVLPLMLPLAEAGDPKAQNIVGLCYRDAVGVSSDKEKALHWFRRAAQQGEAKAQSNLGHLLAVDSPLSPTREEALMWILISMGQGELTAKKTYDELLPSFPAELLSAAGQRAASFKAVSENEVTASSNTSEKNP